MLLQVANLGDSPDLLEEVERISTRMVTQALLDYRILAAEIFGQERDQVADIGEDITREAMDLMGVSRIDQRLFGKIDYKRACYVFHPDFAVKQALFIDSKAEKVGGHGTATLQTSQLSMVVRQIRAGESIEVAGKLPPVLHLKGEAYLTTTLFVKYNYGRAGESNQLQSITVAAAPNGMLQDRYNPSAADTIWLAGRDAPTLDEEFRVRLSFSRLRRKAPWRVQEIPMAPLEFQWSQ